MGIMKRYRRIIATVAMTAALALGLGSTAFAYNGPASVATDDLNLRSGASLNDNVIDCLPRGAVVTVNFDAGYGWYQVTYNGKTGYMAGYYLLLGDTGPAAQTAAAESAAAENTAVEVGAAVEAPQVQQTVTVSSTAGSGKGSINGNEVRLRSGPSMNSQTITYLNNGTPLNVHGMCGSWYEVEYGGYVGYVYSDYVLLSGQSVTYTMTVATLLDNTAIYTEPVTEATYVAPEAPTVVTTETPVTPETPAAETPAQPSAPEAAPETVVETGFVHNPAAGQAIVDTAMQMLGVPYVWGGESLEEGGFDCSGLVYYSYGQHGITLNRVAQAMYYDGVDVDLNDLQAGDILLFGSSVYNIWHAAIYVANGMFIHAPYSGAVVRTQYLSETYGMRLVAARRLV